MGGIDNNNIDQYFKILYGLRQNVLGGAGSSVDMEFGAGNCMFDFGNLMHIVHGLSHKYVGLSSTEMILFLI